MPAATPARAQAHVPHEPDAPALTPQRRRLFLAITLLAPWLLLLALELLLRAVGYGSSAPLFVPHASRPEWMQVSPDAARRWFRGGPFVPTPELEYFRAVKPEGTLRVFFQGESSAQGFPYGHGGMPSRMLEQRLRAARPGRDVEVVNVAFTAVNSWTLLDQAREIADQRPDAVVIYTGHNEWYGVLGAASAAAGGRPRVLVKALLLTRHSRLAQAIEAGIARLRPRRIHGPDAPRTVMELMAGEQLVPLGSARYEAGLAQFRANLRELLAVYRARGIPVLIGTIASNERDQPPLEGTGGEAWRLWTIGQGVMSTGDTAGAHDALRKAKDEDALRFRAPEAINAIIREEAARRGGVTLVPTQWTLERASPGGIVGRELMLEHLHPNLDGYALVADAFFDVLRKRGIGGAWPAGGADSSGGTSRVTSRELAAVTPIDSLVGLLRTDRLTSGWPFRPRGRERTPVVDTLQPRTAVEQLAQSVVLGRLPWGEATERLRDAAEKAGDHALALRAAAAMAAEIDWSPEPCIDAARAALALGRDGEALRWAQRAVAREETAAGVRLLGLAHLRRGEREAALLRLRRAAQLAPADRRMQAVLGSAEALPELERRRAAAPRDTSVLFELALAYAFTEHRERARDVVLELRRTAPGFSRLKDLERLAAP